MIPRPNIDILKTFWSSPKAIGLAFAFTMCCLGMFHYLFSFHTLQHVDAYWSEMLLQYTTPIWLPLALLNVVLFLGVFFVYKGCLIRIALLLLLPVILLHTWLNVHWAINGLGISFYGEKLKQVDTIPNPTGPGVVRVYKVYDWVDHYSQYYAVLKMPHQLPRTLLYTVNETRCGNEFVADERSSTLSKRPIEWLNNQQLKICHYTVSINQPQIWDAVGY